MKHALVVGATGVIGSAMVERLVREGRWDVTCATRGGRGPAGTNGISVDLLDVRTLEEAGRRIEPVTHLFYAAYQQRPSRFEEIEPNLRMLEGAVEFAERGAKLEHVVLITGGKHYGVQWGATKTPARETDPRHLAPNFYYDQEDYLARRQPGADWSWTNLVPPYVTGVSDKAPMNLVVTIAVLGTLSRELGLPLRFPGPVSAWNAIHHIADADQIADAATWSATSPTAKNEMFNIANGDPGRWKHTWPVLARYFGVETADPLPVPLTQIEAGMKGVWEKIAVRHGLVQSDLSKLVDWKWADYMFNTAFASDVILELGKIRRAGFTSCVDSESALIARFDQLRELRLIP